MNVRIVDRRDSFLSPSSGTNTISLCHVLLFWPSFNLIIAIKFLNNSFLLSYLNSKLQTYPFVPSLEFVRHGESNEGLF
jgi:hypothetical protein